MAGILTAPVWGRSESASFRLVCKQWAVLHDAHLPRFEPSEGGAWVACKMLPGRFPNLQSLKMSEISDQELAPVLAGRTGLRVLDLEHCYQVTDAVVETLIRVLPSLETLCLRMEQVSVRGIKALGGMRALRSLALKDCEELEHEELEALAGLSELRTLALEFVGEEEPDFRHMELLSGITNIQLSISYKCEEASDEAMQVRLAGLAADGSFFEFFVAS